jgi:hypothetical protein
MRIQLTMLHERDQPVWCANAIVEVAWSIFRVYVLPGALEVCTAHLRQRPCGRGYHALGAIRSEITKQPTVQKAEVCSLPTNSWPLCPSEATDAGPMIRFQFSHPVEENVQGNANEVMPDNDVRVSFV